MTDPKHGIVCQFCKKSYSNAYNLSVHQKTAKFCIDIQQKQVVNIPSLKEEEQFVCEHCNSVFTFKHVLQNHITRCKVKKEQEYEEIKKKNAELSLQNELLMKQIVELTHTNKINAHEIELKDKLLEYMMSEKDKHIQQLLEEVQELKTQIKSKDEYIQNTPHNMTVYQNTTNNTNYNITFQASFEKLVPFTEENVKKKVLSIQPMQLIEFNNYNLMLNFCSNFGRSLTDMVLLTDKSRGLVVVKNKDGEKQKYQVKGFIKDCLLSTESECKQLFNRTTAQLNHLELYGHILPEDQARCQNDLTLLYYYLMNKTMDNTVQNIGTVLTSNCIYVSKKMPQAITQKIEILE